jgi:hypothetical protein
MRVPQKRALKGSQKWLQLVVNQAPHLLDRAIAARLNFSSSDKIIWLSPLEDDGYAEYRDGAFLTRLDVGALRPALQEFWPARGPQWDGLARTSRGEPLLIEAKAHIAELLSPATAAGARSRDLIAKSLRQVKAACGSRAAWEWSGLCYQYTNRLAHLYFLRSLTKVPAYLVFVYFLNATDVHGPTTAEEWTGALRLLHSLLGVDDERLQDRFGNAIVEAFVDVKDVVAAGTGPT